MKIFVTGGTGFIGRPVVDELKKRGHHLLVLSRATHRERGADFIKGDFSDISRWKVRLKKFKPEAAIHLAWEGIPDFSYATSVKNLEGGLALFTALAESGCKKIVAVGSGFEYGNRKGRLREAMHIMPTNAFTAAKHSLHIMGEEIARERGLDFIWLRAFNVYGGAQRAGSLIPYIMRCIVKNAPLRLKNPLARGDFVYVADMARAIADAIMRGNGQATYNVSSGRLTPVKKIAQIVCEEMGTSKAYYDDFLHTARGRVAGGCYADIKNIHKGIGWRPTTNIKAGIKKTVKEFLNFKF